MAALIPAKDDDGGGEMGFCSEIIAPRKIGSAVPSQRMMAEEGRRRNAFDDRAVTLQ